MCEAHLCVIARSKPAHFKEVSQRQRAIGNIVPNLTDQRLESQTYHSRNKRVTARPTDQYCCNYVRVNTLNFSLCSMQHSPKLFTLLAKYGKLKNNLKIKHIPIVGKLRLADINFVAFALNRNITNKLRVIYFINTVCYFMFKIVLIYRCIFE